MEPTLPDPFTSHQSWQSTRQPPSMNPINPPSFRLQQPRRITDSMSELETLRVRSIELETELRLTKEHLLQAQSGTQYLVNCFANQQDRSLVQGASQDHRALQSRNQQLETEVHRTRGQPLVQSKEKLWSASPVSSKNGKHRWSGEAEKTREQELIEEVEELKDQRASLLNDVLILLEEDANEYSFKFDDGDPARYKPLECFKEKAAAAARRHVSLLDGNLTETSKDLDPSFVRNSADRERRADSPLASRVRVAKQPSIYVRPGDMALLDLDHVEQPAAEPGAPHGAFHTQVDAVLPARSALNLAEATEAPCSPLPRANQRLARRPSTPPHLRHRRGQQEWPQDFAHFEHQHLMSNATFIEEKDWDEYLRFWKSLEEEKRFSGRHSKEEWKAYYESKVRPAFLQKMAQRSGPAVHKAVGAQTTKGDVTAEEIKVTNDTKIEEGTAVAPTGASLPNAESKGDERTAIPAEIPDRSSSSAVDDPPQAFDNAITPQLARNRIQVDVEPNKAEVSKYLNDTLSESVSDREASGKGSAVQNADASIVMPAVPSFGSLSMVPEPATGTSDMPLPGLAGGWPKPAPRERVRPARRTAARVSEKDPWTWKHLFFALKQTGSRSFVLGQKEKLLRTVLISEVPVGTKLVEVLDQVRGGKLVSAKFLDTAGMKTQPPVATNTVVVEFLGSKQAQHFVERCQKNPLILGLTHGETQAKAEVKLVRTQTWPLHPEMIKDMISTESALTRVLSLIFVDFESVPEVEVITREITAFAIKRDYFTIPAQPLRVTSGEDRMLLLEYADVRQAAAAWNAISALEWKLGQISKGFATDPCEAGFKRVGDGRERLIVEGATDEEVPEGLGSPGEQLEADTQASSGYTEY